MGVELKVLGRSIGRWRVVEEVGDAVADENHGEEGLPFVIVVICGVEKKLDVVGDVIIVDGEAGSRGRRRRRGGGEKGRKLRAGRGGGAAEERV